MKAAFLPALLLLLALALPGAVRADDEQASKEARLRDALKSAYEQLQSAQAATATLQAAQAESEMEKDALKTQAQTLADELKTETTKSTLASQAAQAQIGQLKLDQALLHRKIDDDETRNLALYALANEILTRYEKFSLGDALAAKEPFTQLNRVKLENLVQGYQDKLVAQKVGTPAPAAAPGASAADAK
jgi:hypothetical protein